VNEAKTKEELLVAEKDIILEELQKKVKVYLYLLFKPFNSLIVPKRRDRSDPTRKARV